MTVITCVGKASYPSVQVAWAVANRNPYVGARRRAPRPNVYRCPECRAFHLGHTYGPAGGRDRKRGAQGSFR